MKQEIARELRQIQARMQVTSLPFSSIPGQSRLFLEYLSDPASLSDLYPNLDRLRTDPKDYSAEVLLRYETDRSALCEALNEVNAAAGAGDATFGNIELLSEADTVAVVTGQQAGLFTGPLFTIYKALSAIRYAERLQASGIRAVPMFWIATEDHDFDEVSSVNVINRSDLVENVSYRPQAYLDEASVGSAILDGDIQAAIEKLFEKLPQTEFSASARVLVEQSWNQGAGFGSAFASMLLRILDRFGIIIVDPMNAGLKRLASPIYRKAIERSDEIVAAIRAKTAALESAGLHAQVSIDEDHFPMFWQDEVGRRNSLRKTRDNAFRAKLDKRELTRAELERIAVERPEFLSPGVMLRSVVQDYLLPTVCYFGGAAEVAYFAQNSGVYETLDRPVTPIFHRQSVTIVEAKQRKTLDKLGLQFEDLLSGKDKIRRRVSEYVAGKDAAILFAEVEERINTELDRLDRYLAGTDVTLAESLAKRRRKITHHIEALRDKSLRSALVRDEVLSRRLDSLLTDLLPGGQLQERSLNVVNYINKFGLALVDWVHDAVDLDDSSHRVVDL